MQDSTYKPTKRLRFEEKPKEHIMDRVMDAPVTFDRQDWFELSILVQWIILTVSGAFYGAKWWRSYRKSVDPDGLYRVYSMPDVPAILNK